MARTIGRRARWQEYQPAAMAWTMPMLMLRRRRLRPQPCGVAPCPSMTGRAPMPTQGAPMTMHLRNTTCTGALAAAGLAVVHVAGIDRGPPRRNGRCLAVAREAAVEAADPPVRLARGGRCLAAARAAWPVVGRRGAGAGVGEGVGKGVDKGMDEIDPRQRHLQRRGCTRRPAVPRRRAPRRRCRHARPPFAALGGSGRGIAHQLRGRRPLKLSATARGSALRCERDCSTTECRHTRQTTRL